MKFERLKRAEIILRTPPQAVRSSGSRAPNAQVPAQEGKAKKKHHL